MKIAMIGTGYVGLVSGVCLSDFGHEVVCVDKNADKLALLRAGKTPIFEPGLARLMARNTATLGRSWSEVEEAAETSAARLADGLGDIHGVIR